MGFSRLFDINGILYGLNVTYDNVAPLVAESDPALHAQVTAGFDDLLGYVADLYSQEQAGVRFNGEQADLFGSEAQARATALSGQVAQAAALLNVVVDMGKPANRRAESAGVAQLYWRILQPAYAAQQGTDAAAMRAAQFDALTIAVGQSPEPEVQAIGAELQRVLGSFRAAPLSPAEQARRAGQLMRYLALVPVEYGRGVSGDQVIVPIEIQEAVTFITGAQAALADLHLTLVGIDAAQTAVVEAKMARVADHLNAANQRKQVRSPEAITAEVTELTAGLETLFPAEWLAGHSDADFDVLATVLGVCRSIMPPEFWTKKEAMLSSKTSYEKEIFTTIHYRTFLM